MTGNRAADSAGPRLGLAEWFHPGDYTRVEKVLEKARALDLREIRTAISWADW
jgi:hypothetical protein